MTHALSYLAIRYNFADRRATMMGQRRAANDLHMERKTFSKAVLALEEWGWVSVEKSFNGNPNQYTLLIGNEISDLKWTEETAKKTQLEEEKRKKKGFQ